MLERVQSETPSEPEVNRKVDIFFYVSEFLFGVMLEESKFLFRILPGGDKNSYYIFHRYVLPFFVLFWLYITDSYVGKLTAIYVACGMGVILQFCIIIFQAADVTYDVEAVRIAMKVVGDILRPVRWALLYTTKPIRPFKVIRRFLILTESSYLLGKMFTKAVKMFILPTYDHYYQLEIIIPVGTLIKLTLYPLFVQIIYKNILHFPMHFKLFTVENAVKDTSSVVLKKLGKKCHRFQETSPKRNEAVGVGILVLLAIFTPYCVARFDYEIIKQFSRVNRDFLIEKNMSGAIETIEPIVTMLTLLVLEFVVLSLANNTSWRPYYLTWLTVCYIIILVAFALMIYIYLMLEREMPFPKLPPGKAHLTVFNCLPASTEIEWSSLAMIDKIWNQYYIRKLLITLKEGKDEQMEVVVYNKPTGLYQKVNITLEEGRENVYVATYDGLVRSNLTEKLAFNRFGNEDAQVRILDCLEECCHGNISFTPITQVSSTAHRVSTNITLTTNLLSAKYEFLEGQYSLAYHPDENTTLKMGDILLKRLDKTILLVHSLRNPGYKVWNMVLLSRSNSAIYIPMVVLVGIFRIAHAFVKLAIVMKTIPEIYAVAFGVHVTITSLARFAATAYFNQLDLDQIDFFMMFGLSMLGFVVYLAVLLKLRKHFQVDSTPRDEQNGKTRHRTSKASILTTETTGTATDTPGVGKMKNQ